MELPGSVSVTSAACVARNIFGLENSSIATGLSGSGGFFGGVNRRLHITRLFPLESQGDNLQTYGGGRQYGSKNRDPSREECVWVLCRRLPKGSAALTLIVACIAGCLTLIAWFGISGGLIGATGGDGKGF